MLYTRYKAGIVTDEMIGLPKYRFMIIGFLEALGVVCGMSAGGVIGLFSFSSLQGQNLNNISRKLGRKTKSFNSKFYMFCSNASWTSNTFT